MAKISVTYDYFNDMLCPMHMLIHFGKGNFDWSKNYIYIPVNSPFKRKRAEDILDDTFSLSVASTELVMNKDKEGYFGIHIPTVKSRINKLRGEAFVPHFQLEDIEQFVIQIGDIEEILAMDKNVQYTWR
ncbi:hypothetical protein BC351_00710 [Paenibacillus ferrarius]|uniref:Uncharacterized protein n=1 Tax=Paenibacillus ferrarius TaxID=1469647 RepID=A0A1V4HS75_9BACL|nr:hypothetical protein [Paenibacillus ferrarius]OPH61794.1 hypothetical protein BC351_00710 [Paenibacillus ferrarius]